MILCYNKTGDLMQRYFGKMVENRMVLDNGDIFHVKKVMRMRKKDRIEVVVEGHIFLCEIASLDPFVLNFIREMVEDRELYHQVTIAQGLVKEQKMDFVLQKCTELGMYAFIPLELERCTVKIKEKKEKKVERWQRICKEASEQSYRAIVPNVLEVMSLKQLLEMDFDLKLVCSTKNNLKTIKNVLQSMPSCVRILVVIGPEGGLEEKEEILLERNGFIRISLGQRILRTESAPIFVMSAILYEEMIL